MEDLQEHLAELFGGSAYDDTVTALGERNRRYKPPGKHAPEIPPHSVPVAPLGPRAFALLQYLTSFEFIDKSDDHWRQIAIDLLSITPAITFAPWYGGKCEIVSDCTKLSVPADAAPGVIAYVVEVENANSDLISEKVLAHVLTLLDREPEVIRTIVGERELATRRRASSIEEQARAIVHRVELPRLLQRLSEQSRVALTAQLIARYGRSTAGSRHHMFKRETLIDWLAHDPRGFARWLSRIGQHALADELSAGQQARS